MKRSSTVDGRRRRCTLVAAVALLLEAAPDSGRAQSEAENEVAPSPANSTSEIFYETATVTDRQLDQATGAVAVVGRDRIGALGAREAAEVLDFVPGVIINRNSRGGLTVAEIRGGDPNFTLVLLDGVPLNDPTDSLGGAFNLASFGVLGLERIEVVRGPASSHYGSTALAGVIQLITRRGGDSMALRAELEAGDFDLERGGAWVGGPLSRRVRGTLALSSEEERGRAGADSFEQETLMAGLDLGAGTRRGLRLRGRLSDWQGEDYPVGSGGPLLGLGLLRRSDHGESSLGLHFDSAAGQRHQQRLSATFYRHRLDREAPPIPPQVPPSIEATELEHTRLLYRSVFASESSHLGAGIELERQEGTNRSLLLLPEVFGGPLPGDYDRRRDQGGLFVEGARRWASDWGSLTLEAGARLDSPDGASDQLSPRFGVGFRPRNTPLRLRASAGRAFKQPSLFALASPPQLGGNPELAPETSTGIDLGLDVEAGEALRLAFTLFSTRYRDLIDFDFATFRLVNRSAVVARGGEASLEYSPHPRLRLVAQLTAQQVEDRDSGLELLRRPESSAALSLELQPARSLRVLFDLRALGSSFDQQVGGARQKLAAHELLGLAAAWRLRRGLELTLRLDNLADEEHQTQLGLPGAGRSLRAGLRCELGSR